MPKNMYIFFALSLLVSNNALQSAELAESALKVADAVHADADRGTDAAEKNKEAAPVTAATEAQTTETTEQAVAQVEETVTAPVAVPAVVDNSAADATLDELFTNESDDESEDLD